MHISSVRFGSAKKIGGSVRFGFGKKFLVRSFPNIYIPHVHTSGLFLLLHILLTIITRIIPKSLLDFIW